MSELEDKISEVLGNPEQMAKITKLASSLMGGGEFGTEDTAKPDGGQNGASPPDALGSLGLDAESLGRISRLVAASDTPRREEEALLAAMKPYLSEKRRGKIDRAMKLARLARIARIAMSEEGEGHS